VEEAKRQRKLRELCEQEGFLELEHLLDYCAHDSVVPAICINDGCSYGDDLEPDQRAAPCPECRTNSVQSVLVLAQLI
jgi:hypothetical protein